jgi:hypothetical protein
VDEHGGKCFHHIATLVEEIETAMQVLKLNNVEFAEKLLEILKPTSGKY